MNAAAMYGNGLKMPIFTTDPYEIRRILSIRGDWLSLFLDRHTVAGYGTRFEFLCDRIEIFGRAIASVGDLFIFAGILVAIIILASRAMEKLADMIFKKK